LFVPVVGDIKVQPELAHGSQKTEFHGLEKLGRDRIVQGINVQPDKRKLFMKFVKSMGHVPTGIAVLHDTLLNAEYTEFERAFVPSPEGRMACHNLMG